MSAACLVLALAVSQVARAQEEGDAEPSDDAPAAAPTETDNSLPPEDSPLVGEPRNPGELMEAALLMIEIARPRLARTYLDRLLAQGPDAETLLALRDRFGAAAFLRLSNFKELRPTATRLLDLVNTAVSERARDPERIKTLIQQLDGTPAEQVTSIEELRAAGPLGVPEILAVLDDSRQQRRQTTMLQALIEIGDPAEPVLFGALDAPSPELRTFVVTALGHIGSQQAIPYLWYPSLSPKEVPRVQLAARRALARLLGVPLSDLESLASEGVVARLLESGRGHYERTIPWTPDEKGQVALWSWDPGASRVTSRSLDEESASDLVGFRFASQALALSPELPAAQELYLSLALTQEARRAGWGAHLPTGPGTAFDLALTVGPDLVGKVVVDALESSHPETAVAALQVLEQTATLSQLKSPQGRQAPLLTALASPDTRVQFAAASAILQLNPQEPFSQSSRVVSVLRRAVSGESHPRSIICDPVLDRGGSTGGQLAELGYDPILVATGRDVFREASVRPDIDLIVLHPNIIRWALSETVANLRADSRTAGIPIIILGPAELRSKLQRILNDYRWITYLEFSPETEGFEPQVRAFLGKIRTPPLTADERLAQERRAVAWMAHIATTHLLRVFPLANVEAGLSALARDPMMHGDAIQVLAEIPSAPSQQLLADVALDSEIPNDNRAAAASALAFHIQRFGLLLSQKSIPALHSAWRGTADDALRVALGSVLGSLKPDTTLIGKRLQSYSAPGTGKPAR